LTWKILRSVLTGVKKPEKKGYTCPPILTLRTYSYHANLFPKSFLSLPLFTMYFLSYSHCHFTLIYRHHLQMQACTGVHTDLFISIALVPKHL
jgi:hypothetical protein